MKYVVIVIILVLLAICYVIAENKNLKVTRYTVFQENVPEAFHGLKITCLTDLHNNCYGRHNQRLIQKIKAENPDIICVAGDIISAGSSVKNKIGLSLIIELSRNYPVYYCPGNHEEKWKRLEKEKLQKSNKKVTNGISYQEYIEALKDAGVILLDNEHTLIRKGDGLLSITGLNLPLDYYYKGPKKKNLSQEDLTKLAGKPEPDAYQLLLAHMPIYFKEYAEWGADLVLSGHVHGGIVILPWLGGVISPQYELFPKYDYGVFEENQAKLLLSRGLGTHTIRVRVFNRPELLSIELKKS